jgi:hypothetical protein
MDLAKEMMVHPGTGILSRAAMDMLAQANKSSIMFATTKNQNQNLGSRYPETDFLQRPVKYHMKELEKLMDD